MNDERELYYGDTVELVAEIHGAEGIGYTVQWQYYDEAEEKEENRWKDIGGATGETYRFVVTEENAGTRYRVVVKTN